MGRGWGWGGEEKDLYLIKGVRDQILLNNWCGFNEIVSLQSIAGLQCLLANGTMHCILRI